MNILARSTEHHHDSFVSIPPNGITLNASTNIYTTAITGYIHFMSFHQEQSPNFQTSNLRHNDS
jgi:hypothetical protein